MRISVSLRVHGTHLDRDSVNRRLGREATYFHRAGEMRVGTSGRQYARFREDLWELESQAEHYGCVSEDISALLSSIDREGIKILLSDGCVIDVFVGVFLDEELGDISLPSALMLELGQLGMIVDFSLYP